MKNGDIVIAPQVMSNHITSGKEYEVRNVMTDLGPNDRTIFTITNDIGTSSLCLLKGCAHLDGNDWIIKNK